MSLRSAALCAVYRVDHVRSAVQCRTGAASGSRRSGGCGGNREGGRGVAETTGQGGACACVSGAAVGTTIVLSSVFTRLPSAERGIFGPEMQHTTCRGGRNQQDATRVARPNNNKGL